MKSFTRFPCCGGFFDIACDIGKTIEKGANDTGKTIEKAAHDTGHATEKAAHDVGKAVEKATGTKPLEPLREWLAAKDIPPVGAGAYGLVVFHSKPTAANRKKLKMVCDAFVAFFPPAEKATVPLEDQMITVWPLDNPDAKEAKEDNCDYALDHYDLIAAGQAVSDAQRQHANFDDAGPYLVGWSPSKTRRIPDALVLVMDMSADNSQAEIDAKFLFWKNKIVQDPAAWRDGFSIERVRVAIHNFVDQYGQAMVDTIKLIGNDKKL
jgi:hypothetical protein